MRLSKKMSLTRNNFSACLSDVAPSVFEGGSGGQETPMFNNMLLKEGQTLYWSSISTTRLLWAAGRGLWQTVKNARTSISKEIVVGYVFRALDGVLASRLFFNNLCF